ncbi:MAG: hypothetical protein N4J56_004103 [Chroococcidiopsis sp. SAG 2025]|uniref:hypothetical protein n=1 Tax=Chroococcidiopsis sp. SAG 2025 TaxID=171389 RepID=UPI002936F497|nr:hypothetical protein [Chroococcidiopsis sp. SAG 2025]MDV2994449.1 hypothetical protein [Chroococcidiopsis sp. SAG 2025]
MDSSQQLKQLVSADIPSLSKYYREMAAQQGAGVLVVNYYPTGEVAQMEARFLTSSQIQRIARQMGLPTLQAEFEQHDQKNQMVIALVTAQTKGVVTVEVEAIASETPSSEIPATKSSDASESNAKRKSSARTSQERKSTAKTTTQRQAKKQPKEAAIPKPETPEESPSLVSSQPSTQIEATAQPTVEPDSTPKSSSKGKTTAKTSKPATRGKTATKTTTKQKPQPEVSS